MNEPERVPSRGPCSEDESFEGLDSTNPAHQIIRRRMMFV
jgi:hypothetical protein